MSQTRIFTREDLQGEYEIQLASLKRIDENLYGEEDVETGTGRAKIKDLKFSGQDTLNVKWNGTLQIVKGVLHYKLSIDPSAAPADVVFMGFDGKENRSPQIHTGTFDILNTESSFMLRTILNQYSHHVGLKLIKIN